MNADQKCTLRRSSISQTTDEQRYSLVDKMIIMVITDMIGSPLVGVKLYLKYLVPFNNPIDGNFHEFLSGESITCAMREVK